MNRRLSRLQLKKRGWFRLLALDHGLTVGTAPGSPPPDIEDLVRRVAPFIDGVVLTYGMAVSQRSLAPNLIVQCFGAPKRSVRVQVAGIESVLRLDAAAVSVQLDLSREGLSRQTREVAHFIHQAHAYDVPVLFMVSGFEVAKGLEVLNAIRVCHELGADLIKVEIDAVSNSASGFGSDFREHIRYSPPILLAGGGKRDDMIRRLGSAVGLGFSGFCIGRSIFGADDPETLIRELDNCLRPKKGKSI